MIHKLCPKYFIGTKKGKQVAKGMDDFASML